MGTQYVAYSKTFGLSDGTPPFTFEIIAGSLPSEMMFSSGGHLRGTPLTAATSTITVRATDVAGCVTTLTTSLVISAALPRPSNCPGIVIEGSNGMGGLSNGTALFSFYAGIQARAGGTAPYQWGITDGTLPSGMYLTSDGYLLGTPLVAGTYPLRVRVTDGVGCFSEIYGTPATIKIFTTPTPPATCSALTVGPSTLPDSTVGNFIEQEFTMTGGTSPYFIAMIDGALPAGVIVWAGHSLMGTMTTAGLYPFTIRAHDSQGCPTTVSYTIRVASACPAISLQPSALPAGSVGVSYFQPMSGVGGTSPYTFSVQSGAQPAGLTLSTDGILSGTPTAVGTSSLVIRGTDAGGCFAQASYSIGVTSIFTDDPFVPGVTAIKAIHVLELRRYLDQLLARYGWPAFNWSDPSLSAGSSPVSVTHLSELRRAVGFVYQAAGLLPPSFTDPDLESGVTPLRAVHLAEIRAAIRAIY